MSYIGTAWTNLACNVEIPCSEKSRAPGYILHTNIHGVTIKNLCIFIWHALKES